MRDVWIVLHGYLLRAGKGEAVGHGLVGFTFGFTDLRLISTGRGLRLKSVDGVVGLVVVRSERPGHLLQGTSGNNKIIFNVVGRKCFTNLRGEVTFRFVDDGESAWLHSHRILLFGKSHDKPQRRNGDRSRSDPRGNRELHVSASDGDGSLQTNTTACSGVSISRLVE